MNISPVTRDSKHLSVTNTAAQFATVLGRDIRYMYVCTVPSWVKQANGTQISAYKDFADVDVGDLDTIIEAVTSGIAGNNITVAMVGDNDAEVAATLDCSTLADGDFDTILEAIPLGALGNAVTVRLIGDSALLGGVTISEVGSALTIHYESGVSTVDDVETALGASTLVTVITPGTSLTVLTAPADNFVATAMAGGVTSEGVTIEEDTDDLTVLIHYAIGESTVDDVETAIDDDSTLIQVKTTGTGVTVLDGDSAFTATNLAHGGEGADNAEPTATAGDGSMFVPAGVVLVLDGRLGNTVSAIRSGGSSGDASITPGLVR